MNDAEQITHLQDVIAELLATNVRLDERVRQLIEQRSEINDRLDEITKELRDLSVRVAKLEVTAARSETNLQRWLSWGMQLLYAVIASYLIWKFGLNGSLPP
jgi:septal ring factor EnvC (AmiA/AmiB activator)